MKILVTGGAGFIGSHVIDALRARGADTLCIDSLDAGVYHGVPDYLRRDVDYCFADLRDWQPDARYQDVEAIVHLAALGGVGRAAREPANILDANVRGTARLLEAARCWPQLRRIVHISSFSVYGANYTYQTPSTGCTFYGHRRIEDLERGDYEVKDPETGETACIVPIDTSAAPNPLETYGASKYMQELCYRGFLHCPVTTVRFSSVYGDRLRLDDGEATIIARLAGWIRSGQRPKLYEDGKQIRDWVFVGDVVEAIVRIVEGAAAPPILNICSGVPTTLLEATEILQRVLEVECPAEVVGGYRPGDMRHCLGDAAPLTELLGRPPVPFRQGAMPAFCPQKRG
jgi:dTDP-L-rhamnose 4-epimerase